MRAERTGIEGYLHNLLPELCNAWRGGSGDRSVTVFARSEEVVAHVTPRPTVVSGGGRGWTQLRLPAALRRNHVAIYFTPIPILPLFLPLPCAAVVTVHDLVEFRRKWWYFRRLVGRTVDRAAAVVCVSEATRQDLLADFPDVAPKTVVVHEGADPSLFHPPDEGDARGAAILDRLGISSAPLLAVGTIQPRKNYDRMIGAYARVLREAPDAPPLVIVGTPGWGDFDATLALPTQLGIADKVLFAGYLDIADVADLMRASRLLLALSTGEGFGLPLVEAMHTGLPILASDIPVFREVAGVAARFVPSTDEAAIASAIARLVQDPDELAEMTAAGLGRRELFSWPRAGAAVAALLERHLTPL